MTVSSMKDNMNDKAVLFRDVNYNMDTGQVFELLSSAQLLPSPKFSTSPPVKPKGGQLYLFDLGNNSLNWDLRKKQFRHGILCV